MCKQWQILLWPQRVLFCMDFILSMVALKIYFSSPIISLFLALLFNFELLRMALSLGIFIGIYFVLKCYYQKRQSLVKNLKINKKTDEIEMVTCKHVVYMPLNNNASFRENKIDDFNIQFDIVKQSDC